MMNLHQIPIFTDNYVWLIEDQQEALVVDPGEATAVLKFLKIHKLNLSTILITHEHADHVSGVAELQAHFPECNTFWNRTLKDKEVITFNSSAIEVWNTPGHIKNHVSFYLEQKDWLFCGDTLFSLGCGRILEGEFATGCAALFASLELLKKRTKPTTKVFCTHEYTMKNLAFTQSLDAHYHLPPSIEAELQKRLRESNTTIPSTMEFEMRWNSFLKVKTLDEFKRLRELRNRF